MIRAYVALLLLTVLTLTVPLAGCRGTDQNDTQIQIMPVTPPARLTPVVSERSPGLQPGASPVASDPRQAGTLTPAPTPTQTTPASVVALDQIKLNVERVAGGFTEPLLVTHSGDGSGRIFVLEKIGRVRLLSGAVILDITDRVKSPRLASYEREQGLLGLAFHPRFGQNGLLYVHYNDRQGNHVVSRFRVGADGRGDAASEKVLLTQQQPESNFNGGMITFGPDGYLYIGFGTGGTKPELQENAQNLGSLMGKILRIDVDGGEPYGIPPDNPFVNRPGARPEVWAYGLRNPWRFSFDRATGDLYIGGPGEFKREWINFQPAALPPGQNFGWPILEGTTCWRQPGCDPQGVVRPILEYETYENGNCVVIGGGVYRGTNAPVMQGAYLYGDFCTGRIWAAARNAAGAWVSRELYQLTTLISSFGEDEAGEFYVTDIHNGVVYRLSAVP